MKSVYFIGIGGIGMSAGARYFKAKGFAVSGYDKTPSELTEALQKEGIDVHYEDDIARIPPDKENTLVVYTPAIPAELGELKYVMSEGYRVVKRSRMLGEIANGMHCLAVSGTHGKTTTSTLLAHIFTGSGTGCNAFLGGISKNYDSNLLLSDNNVIVAEADEFDRSFLQLYPDYAVITAMDADHLDIYGDLSHVKEAFKAFAAQVKKAVIVKQGLDITPADTTAKILHYSYDDVRADFHAENLKKDKCGYFDFSLVWPGGRIDGCRVGVPGWVNVENAVAASAIALSYGVAPEAVRKALLSFQGVKRRFDIQVNKSDRVYIDDYAHHPNELSAAIRAIREMFPGRTLTGIFQPHLYTRTRDFASEFAAALSGVDQLILLDIYPAREEPIPGVTSDLIFKDVTCPRKVLITKEALMEELKKTDIDVLVSFGAGNIDRFITPIKEWMEHK
ncbi:MAG: UDP-N-acetylmuramate--L-alanine ligase [Bacteroidales bacterium]|nr:UDP-N-acetylmuramate--L-alanine ligase [Bacteroidales bacterium]